MPHKVTLIDNVLDAPDSDLSAFTGDREVTQKTYEFTALYNREIQIRERQKYGLTDEVNGIIFLSPLELIPKRGSFQVDTKLTKIFFAGKEQIIERVDYLEPLYNSCIAVQIFVKDTING